MSRSGRNLDELRTDLLESLPRVLPDGAATNWLTGYILAKVRQHFLGEGVPNAREWARIEREWRIRELLLKGVPVQIVAERTGVHRCTVHRIAQVDSDDESAA